MEPVIAMAEPRGGGRAGKTPAGPGVPTSLRRSPRDSSPLARRGEETRETLNNGQGVCGRRQQEEHQLPEKTARERG